MNYRLWNERFLMDETGGEGGTGGSGGAGNEGDKNKGGEAGKGTGGSEGAGNEGDKNKGGKAGKGTGGSEGGEGKDGSGDQFDLSKQPKEVQDLVKSLRAENAKYRTGNKSLTERLDKMEKGFITIFGEEDQDSPEVKAEKLSQTAQELEVKNALLELAIDHGVAKDQREYFEFLMAKKLDALEEGQEMSEEDLEEILAKVKPAGFKGAGNSSVDDKNNGTKNPNSQTEVNMEQFLRMSLTQKSKLFIEKPDVYNALMSEAKMKKLI